MTEHFFSIYGVNLQVTTDSSPIAQSVSRQLRLFEVETVPEPIHLRASFYEVGDRSEIPLSSLVGSFPDCPQNDQNRKPQSHRFFTFLRDGNRLVFDYHKHGLLHIDVTKGESCGYLVQQKHIPGEIRSDFFHHNIRQLLRLRGLYTIHSAALESQGKGLLISGPPNQGKTTLSLALLQAGYRFLADDYPFIRENGSGVDLLSTFSNWLHPRPKTLEFFPELQNVNQELDWNERYPFRLEDVYPQRKILSCRPTVVLFPLITHEAKSYLEPVPKRQAMTELLPQGLRVLNEDVAQREFQLYSRLVQQVACYRLYFGQDFEDLPQLINPLMEAGIEV